MRVTITEALTSSVYDRAALVPTCVLNADEIFSDDPVLASDMVIHQILQVEAIREGTHPLIETFNDLASDQKEDWLLGRSVGFALRWNKAAREEDYQGRGLWLVR